MVRIVFLFLLFFVMAASAQSYNLSGRNAFSDTLIVNNLRKNSPITRQDSLDVFKRISNLAGVRAADYSTTLADSNQSEANGQSLKRAIKEAAANRSAVFLPNDTTWIDSIAFENLNDITLVGPAVVAYRSATKNLSTNIMFKFTNCKRVLFKDITFVGFTGHGPNYSGDHFGYNTAVIPLYFEGGGVLEENEHITIKDCIFKDSWWIGFGGEVVSATTNQVADTVARYVRIDGCVWTDIAQRGPLENLGNKAILSLGSVHHLRVQDCEYNAIDRNGIRRGNGFYFLPGCYDVLILNNRSYDAFDSDYYSLSRRIDVIGNKSFRAGKDNFKNIDLTGTIASLPSWPGVGYARYINNHAEGSGDIILGSPIGYNVDGVFNELHGNTFIGEDTLGYAAKQSQIGIKTGPKSYGNIISKNVLYGGNDLYSGRPGKTAIQVSDTLNQIYLQRNVISDNIINGWETGILLQFDTKFPLITRNNITNIDSVAMWDFGGNNGTISFLYNYIGMSKHVYRVSGVDSLIRIFNTYEKVNQIDGSSPTVNEYELDTLNIRY